jgi:hypothetical protein
MMAAEASAGQGSRPCSPSQPAKLATQLTAQAALGLLAPSAVSRWVENRHGPCKFVKTACRYRTIEIQA